MIDPDDWCPPSTTLRLREGIWEPASISDVSYPDHSNDGCFQVEDESFWFAHRNECIRSLLERFPPGGMFFDIGGGNGYVAACLQKAGAEVALIEPGTGAFNARKRGVCHIIHAALQDTGFELGALPAAGAFDVVEHISDDLDFLSTIHRYLAPGGRFYCTVPALPVLWSDEDVQAGHYRRYTRPGLTKVMERAGFQIEGMSYIFAWLTLPIFLRRALFFWIKRGAHQSSLGTTRRDHSAPKSLEKIIHALQGWEAARLRSGQWLPPGSSLIACVRKPV